jgi:HSP20 family protein
MERNKIMTTQMESNPVSATPRAELTRTGQTYRPSVDIVEDSHELRIVADMPGTNAESVDIDFEDGTLTIHGRVPQRRGDDVKYLLEEFGIGDFYRVFQIGEVIDATRIGADYTAGVLTVHLPKVEAVKPRKINVEAR